MPVEQPTDPIGLPDIILTDVVETWSRVTMTGDGHGVTACPHCGKGDGLLDPTPWNSIDVADTPVRGRPVTITLLQWQHRCSPCRKSFIPTPASVHRGRRMTHRLIRHIEDRAPRQTKRVIAADVGVSKDQVASITAALAKRLADHHRFPTPVVLGVDDIKMNKQAYTLFTEAETGRGVGFIDGARVKGVERFMRQQLDLDRIQVVVSDLGWPTLAATKRKGFEHIIHVADQWHVMKGCRKAMSKLVARHLKKLDHAAAHAEARGVPARQNRARHLAAQMRTHRRALLGKREYLRVSERTILDDQVLTDILKRFGRISRCFWARICLARTHSATDVVTARERLNRFYRIAGSRPVADLMAAAVKTIREHEELILNASRARARLPGVATAAFSTSSTERRNGIIRAAWRAGRGVTDPDYLRLLALYEPWRFDVDIVECGEPGCSAIEGPVSLVPGLSGQERDGAVLPAASFRCLAHRPLRSASVRAA